MRDVREHIRHAFDTVFRELLDGPAERAAFVLNRGDPGLLASLARLPAEFASERPGGRASVAAHVEHLRYGFELLNRWAQEEDPWADADFAASWQHQHVDREQWQQLRAALADQTRRWAGSVAAREDWDDSSLTEVLASAVHLGYHIGAIRQIERAAAGPPAQD